MTQAVDGLLQDLGSMKVLLPILPLLRKSGHDLDELGGGGLHLEVVHPQIVVVDSVLAHLKRPADVGHLEQDNALHVRHLVQRHALQLPPAVPVHLQLEHQRRLQPPLLLLQVLLPRHHLQRKVEHHESLHESPVAPQAVGQAEKGLALVLHLHPQHAPELERPPCQLDAAGELPVLSAGPREVEEQVAHHGVMVRLELSPALHGEVEVVLGHVQEVHTHVQPADGLLDEDHGMLPPAAGCDELAGLLGLADQVPCSLQVPLCSQLPRRLHQQLVPPLAPVGWSPSLEQLLEGAEILPLDEEEVDLVARELVADLALLLLLLLLLLLCCSIVIDLLLLPLLSREACQELCHPAPVE
mmetsp:Transcript_47901/g.150244  ORF Transcript_47901/g.150244 Transcript_47901/m.150244 type:complete len:356 (-) Transcript_47901:126-1193(-)